MIEEMKWKVYYKPFSWNSQVDIIKEMKENKF